MIAVKSFAGLALSAVASMAMAADGPDGKAIYQATCAACHATGAAGAPKLGDAGAWTPRFQAGIDGLYRSALNGKGAMPAKGGNASLSEPALQAAVNFMVLQVDAKPAAAASKPAPAKSAAAAPAKAAPTGLVASAPPAADQSASKGLPVYTASCSACHGTGAAGAPKLADAAAWAPRIKSGVAALYTSALKGKAAMPAKGGNPALADADVKAAVDYMVAQAGGGKAAAAPQALARPEPSPKTAAVPAAATTAATTTAATTTAATTTAATTTAATSAAATSAAPTPAPAVAQAPPVASPPGAPATPAATAVVADANAFNRLLRAPGKRNLAPPEDGIHDPSNDGTLALQPPLAAFGPFPKSNAGNRIDWVKALAENKIQPRYDRIDPNAVPAVMDLNIVREVKGSMPDVVYPHKQHTEWLDCSNCHPAIFIPQKGANQISMAAILLGQKCGVCHGKVAFPVSECRLCHSKNKPAVAASTSAK